MVGSALSDTGAGQTTWKLAIMAMSSCSRLWQCSMYRPLKWVNCTRTSTTS